MDQPFQTEDSPESRRVLEGQLRECYGRVVYSHKTHEKCADILLERLAKIKLAQLIFSALATCGFIGTIFDSGKVISAIGAALSTALLALNSYTKDYDLGELAQRHKQTANDLWLIREEYLTLITDLAMHEKPLESLQIDRNSLTQRLHSIYAGSPSTISKAYKRAQRALKVSEDLTFADAELDALLPPALRRAR